MRVAARNAERVDRLVLLCTAAHLPPAQGWLDRAATVRREGTTAVAEAVVGLVFSDVVDAGSIELALAWRERPSALVQTVVDALTGSDVEPDAGSDAESDAGSDDDPGAALPRTQESR